LFQQSVDGRLTYPRVLDNDGLTVASFRKLKRWKIVGPAGVDADRVQSPIVWPIRMKDDIVSPQLDRARRARKTFRQV
jgi:hypothetical protein